MNKAQKEVQQAQLNDEKKVIKLLELVYEQAKKDCEQKIRELSARTDLENLQSIVYQKEYQQMMVDQLEAMLYDLHEGQFKTMSTAPKVEKTEQTEPTMNNAQIKLQVEKANEILNGFVPPLKGGG